MTVSITRTTITNTGGESRMDSHEYYDDMNVDQFDSMTDEWKLEFVKFLNRKKEDNNAPMVIDTISISRHLVPEADNIWIYQAMWRLESYKDDLVIMEQGYLEFDC